VVTEAKWYDGTADKPHDAGAEPKSDGLTHPARHAQVADRRSPVNSLLTNAA
jgi:hypothetical protein